MQYKVKWIGLSQQDGVTRNHNEEEHVGVESAGRALERAKDIVIEKLREHGKYAVLMVTIFDNTGKPCGIPAPLYQQFLNSINIEGGLTSRDGKGTGSIPELTLEQQGIPEVHWEGMAISANGNERKVKGHASEVRELPTVAALEKCKEKMLADFKREGDRFRLDCILLKNAAFMGNTDDIFDFFREINNSGGLVSIPSDAKKAVSIDSKAVPGFIRICLVT